MVVKLAMSKSFTCNEVRQKIDQFLPGSSIHFDSRYCRPNNNAESKAEQFEYDPNTAHRNATSASSSTGTRTLSAFNFDSILPRDKRPILKIEITESLLRNHIELLTRLQDFEDNLDSAVNVLEVLRRGFDGINKADDKLNELTEFQPTVTLFAEYVLGLFFENQVVMRPGQNESLHYNGITGAVDLLSERSSETGDAFVMELKIPYGALHNSEARHAKKQAIGKSYAKYCSRCRDDDHFVGVCVLTDLIAMSAFIFCSDAIYYIPRNTDPGIIILLMVLLYQGFSKDSLSRFIASLGDDRVEELSDSFFLEVDDEKKNDERDKKHEGVKPRRENKRKYSASMPKWSRILKEEQYEEDLRAYNMWDNARFDVPLLTRVSLLQRSKK